MESIQNFIVNGMYFIIDLATLGLVMASIAILVYAVATMVKNRQPRWDNLLFIPAALLMFAYGLQVLPPLFMHSARIGLADSSQEADLLREELKGWLPEAIPTQASGPDLAGNTHDQISIPPQPTATLIIVTAAPSIEAAAAVALPTSTPLPTPTITSTPAPPVCLGTVQQWQPGCVLPTPEK